MKIGYSPSFIAQNDSRCYKLHCGLVWDLIFGLLESEILIFTIYFAAIAK